MDRFPIIIIIYTGDVGFDRAYEDDAMYALPFVESENGGYSYIIGYDKGDAARMVNSENIPSWARCFVLFFDYIGCLDRFQMPPSVLCRSTHCSMSKRL